MKNGEKFPIFGKLFQIFFIVAVMVLMPDVTVDMVCPPLGVDMSRLVIMKVLW